MRRRQVRLLETAKTDLEALASWLGEAASERFMLDYLARIHKRLDSLAHASERASLRSRNPDLRVIGLMRSITVAFVVEADEVLVIRVLHGGQDWQAALAGEGEKDKEDDETGA